MIELSDYVMSRLAALEDMYPLLDQAALNDSLLVETTPGKKP